MLSRLATFAIELMDADIPASTMASAKTFLADTIACALAGSGSPANETMVKAFAMKTGTFRVPGRNECVDRDDAAILTAHAIHCLEWDAVHEPAVVHAMSVTTGAVLAESQYHDSISGADLLTAIIVGVDIASRLGIAAQGPLRFFRPATAGLLGATAAIARLRGLTVKQTCHAISLGYGQVQGTMQAHLEGTPALAIQVALSARAALTACDMAAAGMTGPQDIFSGPFGYFSLIEDGGDIQTAFASLGRAFAIDDLSIKPYPTGRASHGVLSTVLKYRDSGRLTTDSFAGLVANLPPLVHRLVGRPHKPNMAPAYARLCLPFLVGLALRDGRIDPRQFTDESFQDREIAKIAETIVLKIDRNEDLNALAPQSVAIELKDGSRIKEEIPAALGSPEAPLTSNQQHEKFLFAASIAKEPIHADTANRIVTAINSLDQKADCDGLLQMLFPE